MYKRQLERHKGPALSETEKETVAARKNTLYRDSLKEMSPADLSPSVKHTLDRLRARGVKLAIGSSSKNAPFILGQLGLGDYFDAISDGNNITLSLIHILNFSSNLQTVLSGLAVLVFMYVTNNSYQLEEAKRFKAKRARALAEQKKAVQEGSA